VRAYANIADELDAAGYDAADITRIKHQLDHYLNVREIIRKASGESLDLKAYEADMRHLLIPISKPMSPGRFLPSTTWVCWS
jgi:type I restriction enzyme R subunit